MGSQYLTQRLRHTSRIDSLEETSGHTSITIGGVVHYTCAGIDYATTVSVRDSLLPELGYDSAVAWKEARHRKMLNKISSIFLSA